MSDIQKLEDEIKELKADINAIKTLIQKTLSEGRKIDLTLTIRELAVNLQHAGPITVDLDTTMAEGQILYCAIKDLKREPFTESEISAKLDEHGWHMTHGSLSPALARLYSKKLFIKEGTKPQKYRLPSLVTFRGADIE